MFLDPTKRSIRLMTRKMNQKELPRTPLKQQPPNETITRIRDRLRKVRVDKKIQTTRLRNQNQPKSLKKPRTIQKKPAVRHILILN